MTFLQVNFITFLWEIITGKAFSVVGVSSLWDQFLCSFLFFDPQISAQSQGLWFWYLRGDFVFFHIPYTESRFFFLPHHFYLTPYPFFHRSPALHQLPWWLLFVYRPKHFPSFCLQAQVFISNILLLLNAYVLLILERGELYC